MAINLSDNIKISGPLPVDSRYFNNLVPYTSTGQTNSVIVSGERHIGLTVNINNLEYWYASGTTDNDLVIKTMGGAGTITGAGNGLSVSGGTTIVLGGTLTGATFSGGTLKYAGDYSGTYDARTLVDKGFVTGQTANLQADIDYISGITAQNVLDIDYISGITSQNILDIQYISGITDSNINRLDIIEAEYITGATNGVCKYDDHNVCLGGALSSDITFGCASNTYHLKYCCDYSGAYTDRSIPDVAYVDSVAIGLNVHPAVWVATTGDTLLSGLTTIDGILLQNGDRILVKNQNNSLTGDSANGIYIATGGTWQRAVDYNFTPSGEISNGDLIPVTSGQTQYNSLWSVTSPNPVVSGDPIQFTLFYMPTTFVAGTGITVNLNTISLDVPTQTILAASITGVTNCGGGETVCSSISGHILNLDTIVGSGCTSISKVGNEIIIFSTGATSGGDLYTYASPSICPAGGMCVGTVLTGKTALKLLQEILVPELCGALTPPSFSTTLVLPTTYYEIGCMIPTLSVCGTFNRGCINPQYCSTSDKRVGYATCYVYTGAQVAGTYVTSACTICQPVTNYVVSGTPETWNITVCYGAGVQPLGQYGTPFNSACSVSSLSNSKTICGVYPIFATTSAIGTLTKQSYVAMTTTPVQLTLVAESGGLKDKFEIPNAWTGNPLKCIYTYNTFSTAWEFEGGSGAASLLTWTSSVSSETLCCGSAPYCLYTYNGACRLTTTCIRLVF